MKQPASSVRSSHSTVREHNVGNFHKAGNRGTWQQTQNQQEQDTKRRARVQGTHSLFKATELVVITLFSSYSTVPAIAWDISRARLSTSNRVKSIRQSFFFGRSLCDCNPMAFCPMLDVKNKLSCSSRD